MIFSFELSSPEVQTSDVLEHILDRISSLSLNSPREELLRKFDETPAEETSIAKKSRATFGFFLQEPTCRLAATLQRLISQEDDAREEQGLSGERKGIRTDSHAYALPVFSVNQHH